MEQCFTFDQAASLNSSARPGYPPTLRDEIVSIVGLRREDAILESVAARARRRGGSRLLGYRIVALDPGAQMIEIARESLKEFANIEYVVSTFEAWPARSAAFEPATRPSGRPAATRRRYGRARGPGPGCARLQLRQAGRGNEPSLLRDRRIAPNLAGRCGSDAAAFRPAAR